MGNDDRYAVGGIGHQMGGGGMKLVIPGALPSLNEIIDAAKGHWNNYRELKHAHTLHIAVLAGKLKPIRRADFIITWYCKDMRRDMDNIAAGQKFIFDGLQQAGKLKNDGWKQIASITHRFEVDKHNPRVVVEITESEEKSA